MATKFIEIPMVTIHGDPRLMDDRPRQMRAEQIAERDAALVEYNRLREMGYQVDVNIHLGTYGQGAMGLILHRPDKMPMTIPQEFAEAYSTLLEMERDLGMDISDDKTLSQHIGAIYEKLQQAIRDAETKAAARQPIGELNGTEDD